MRVRDGDWELVDYDHATGRSVWTYFDGVMQHYRTDYPVESIVKDNTALLNDSTGQKFGEGKRVASIPLNLFFDQLQEATEQGDQRYLSRWLNDSDNRKFRTFEGNV